MKKQFIILAILTFFVGISSSYAQCLANEQSPAAGTLYNYSVTIGAPYTAASGTFNWYITKNTDLMNAGAIIANSSGEFVATATYNTPTIGAANIGITWSAAAAGSVYYLVVQYSEPTPTTSPTCTSMNMKVWEIRPMNKFWLEILSFAGVDGKDGNYCAADISAALVTPAVLPADSRVTYTYGSNSIYAKIIAHDYTGDWTPSFQISGLNALQGITAVTWGTTPALATNATTLVGSIYTASSNATSKADGSLEIFVKIVIANNTFENLAELPITIAVDGIIPGTPPLKDVKSAIDCTPEVDFGKTVIQKILARPTVTPGAGTNFIIKN